MPIIEQILMVGPIVLLSLTVHEFAHARMALAFGDDTALKMGRVTLNPLAHLDPIGTLCLLFAHFGWAKPVPINPANLHPRRLGDIMVSLAGPLSNVVLALLFLAGIRVMLAVPVESQIYERGLVMMSIGVSINAVLFTFNLIPLYPLDGHHILREYLPASSRVGFMEWQRRFGPILLLALIMVPRFVDVPIDPIGFLYEQVLGVMLRLL